MSSEELFGSVLLSRAQVEAIVRSAESALDVQRRHQFFVWLQGSLQALMPHQIALCGAYLRQRRSLQFEVFNSVPVPEALQRCAGDAQSEPLRLLQQAWLAAQQRPCAVPWTLLEPGGDTQLSDALREGGFHDALVHGVSRPQRPGEIESFFVLLSRQGPWQEAQRHHLELLMPHIHSTWLRVLGNELTLGELRIGSADAPLVRAITERERDILRGLTEGKSNRQIAQMLGISALTVKNHVQNILRKLGVANRAHAVAHAVALNVVLPPGSIQPPGRSG